MDLLLKSSSVYVLPLSSIPDHPCYLSLTNSSRAPFNHYLITPQSFPLYSPCELHGTMNN